MIIGTRGSYSRETWFDQCFRILGRTARSYQRAYGAWVWPLVFVIFAVALYLTGGAFAYQLTSQALAPAGSVPGGGPLAELGAAALAFAAARHFVRVALQAAPAGSRLCWETPVAQDRLAGGIMLAVVAGVLVPASAAGAFAARPQLGGVFVAALVSVLATTVSLYRLYGRRAQFAEPATAHSPATEARRPLPQSRPSEPAQRGSEAAKAPRAPVSEDPQEFLSRLRSAGLNVRIAKAVYLAGLRSEQQLREVDDEALLAITGVGPATVAKLRTYLAKDD
ncbi:MAG: helix-hairpin-helix domain-containing protein [Gammaproteobacteria bacterium]